MAVQISHLTDLAKCDEVFALYRGDSGTLGWMPKGAFAEGIENRRLLVAKSDSGSLLGYLLYRVVGRKATIAHLCVSKEARGKGVAASLVDELKKQTADLDGITLKCRNDFDAHRFWPRMGFVAKGVARGRGADRAELTIWHVDHGHPDLFTIEPTKTRVVIDANVFFDLWAPDRPKREVSGALTEPWVEDTVDLVLTPEIYNDIQRAGTSEERERSKAIVRTFEEIRPPTIDVDRVVPQLRELYPKSVLLNQRDESDIRHLANTIAAGVKFFVTRDEGLLDKASEVLQQFDVQVFSPVELVSHLDWVAREQAYQPLRLEGSSVSTKRAEALMLDELATTFCDTPSERRMTFRASLEKCLVDPRKHNVHVSFSGKDGHLALIAVSSFTEEEWIIPLVRHAKQELAPTVLRHQLMVVVREAITKNARIIRVLDACIPASVETALEEIGFRKVSGVWLKPLISGFMPRDEILEFLSRLGVVPTSLSEDKIDDLETIIWPAKVSKSDVPCYLIPIRAEWAEHFFDTDLAKQRLPGLSGIREELHLGIEAAYYTSSNIGFRAPGRILWYVSQGNEKVGTMEVKACSRLREVAKAGPKQLFKRFRRLGVYGWKDIYLKAGKKVDAELTALRFSHTERFPNPIGTDLLSGLGVLPPYPGPRPIPHSTFVSIYNQALSPNA
ncbi:GNAT family N-acetyltransferase [Prosthecobacter sp.]|jgi:GNAT superfamily N-acetyltransferase/predicted nucleic acid-binding protein|uniref:GNAT family N-acetyltransferase n=1 Tax=Prosthecobacter sp. TaxID=1965333 RepID=UPI003784EECB